MYYTCTLALTLMIICRHIHATPTMPFVRLAKTLALALVRYCLAESTPLLLDFSASRRPVLYIFKPSLPEHVDQCPDAECCMSPLLVLMLLQHSWWCCRRPQAPGTVQDG
jgi:hypothetical protein